MDESYYKRELDIMTDKVINVRKELQALKEENTKLKAQLWVANDARLRTYDGLAQKADKYDEVVKRLEAVKASLNKCKDLAYGGATSDDLTIFQMIFEEADRELKQFGGEE